MSDKDKLPAIISQLSRSIQLHKPTAHLYVSFCFFQCFTLNVSFQEAKKLWARVRSSPLVSSKLKAVFDLGRSLAAGFFFEGDVRSSEPVSVSPSSSQLMNGLLVLRELTNLDSVEYYSRYLALRWMVRLAEWESLEILIKVWNLFPNARTDTFSEARRRRPQQNSSARRAA